MEESWKSKPVAAADTGKIRTGAALKFISAMFQADRLEATVTGEKHRGGLADPAEENLVWWCVLTRSPAN